MRILVISLLAAIMFSCAGTPQQGPAQVQKLTPNEFKEQNMNSKTVLVDVRTPEEYESGHLDGALLSDFRGGAFTEDMKNWDKDKVYYLYCASGNRSGQAAELMKQAGYKYIYDLGGFQDLKEAGLPTEAGAAGQE
ncbi:rhodanese-like domain-containing protein [Pontibacter anaerobius]|uniref:Rhodanese-like domain-containing protein n=1 Tax=Pontibacter anaerobius TaxID=2993940 RepID=A0ABT3RE54_9BACT|nr:rhodanese-like domain-containing protein [Pontibacter anaerobius]MCX2740129.1 rhodanese-like domain-containing protein [Pontibacter anaerobius]